jgi:hypothetical protein
VGILPSIYLGLPLGSRPLDSFWNSIIDRFRRKLVGWKGALLSQVGKCQLVKSCLQNVPLYSLSIFQIPSKFAEKMERIQQDFLWLGQEGRKRYPLVAWDKVYLPKCNGGLGIRKLPHVNKALLAKQLWCIFYCIGSWRDTLIKKYIGSPLSRLFYIMRWLPGVRLFGMEYGR